MGGVEGKAIHTDLVRAADVARQLNAWFTENAAKLQMQDQGKSPSQYLEEATVALTRHMEGVMGNWTQVQSIFSFADDDDATVTTAACQGAGYVHQPAYVKQRTLTARMWHSLLECLLLLPTFQISRTRTKRCRKNTPMKIGTSQCVILDVFVVICSTRQH